MIIEYAWIYLYKKDSEYALGPKYAKFLHMAWFSICQHSILDMPEYALTERSEYIMDSNKLGFWIWQGSEYAKVTEGSKYATVCLICLNRTWICLNNSEFTIIDRVLNMYHTIYRVRGFYKLMSTYWEIGIFRTCSKI